MTAAPVLFTRKNDVSNMVIDGVYIRTFHPVYLLFPHGIQRNRKWTIFVAVSFTDYSISLSIISSIVS